MVNEVLFRSFARLMRGSLLNVWHRSILLRTPPRSKNPFATAVPILIGLSRILKPKRVLEFGSGEYSTLTFLNRLAFPELKHLTSFETDPFWAERIRGLVGDDSRLALDIVSGAMADAVNNVDLDAYDMIFIDDSTDSAERVATIKAVSSRRPKLSVVVIHDYEFGPYREASKLFQHRFQFKVVNPNVGVLWNDWPAEMPTLRSINRVIRKHANTIRVNDSNRWATVLHNNCKPTGCEAVIEQE